MLDVAADHAGRVHHHVEPRQALDERSYRGVLAHVEAAKRDAAIRGVGLGPLALRIGRAGRENGSPEVAEGERGAEPDAARAAGDEHAAAGEEAGREAIKWYRRSHARSQRLDRRVACFEARASSPLSTSA